MSLEALKKKRIAIPGELTTAFLALRICLGAFEYEVAPFDQIFDAIQRNRVAAGLIIHEGQLTYSKLGFTKVLDLGEWWFAKTGLPLPLGVNGIRKDLGAEVCRRVGNYLKQSIEYGLDHRKEALEYAMQFSRNTDEPLTDQFVGMYVNHFTRELGEKGTRAIAVLLDQGYEAGLLPKTTLEIL